MAHLDVGGGSVELRAASRADIPAIVRLLADDPLGATREAVGDLDDAALAPYLAAFDAVDADPSHLLMVAIDGARQVVATMQLTLIPGLARRGALRAQIEAVHVAATQRGTGLGGAMFEWAIEESRRRGAALVQLTTDKTRVDARRFYERVGFVASHEGLKLQL
ncbi:MAG: family N-acetyltransferase [Jatrophihabitantaceae bacterium]|nr:family N-acetyltransferase [Jatrophihabitantaceae bacterium]